MSQPEKFGTKIRELRKAKNLSQRDLAQEVEKRLQESTDKKGFDFTYLSKIETLGWIPSMPVIQALAKTLEVKEADLGDFYTLAGKANEAMETVIKSDSARQFYRSALRKDLTEEDWIKLLAELNKNTEGR